MDISSTPELEKLAKKKFEVLRAKLELAERSPLIDDFSMDDLINELDHETSLSRRSIGMNSVAKTLVLSPHLFY